MIEIYLKRLDLLIFIIQILDSVFNFWCEALKIIVYLNL